MLGGKANFANEMQKIGFNEMDYTEKVVNI